MAAGPPTDDLATPSAGLKSPFLKCASCGFRPDDAGKPSAADMSCSKRKIPALGHAVFGIVGQRLRQSLSVIQIKL